MEIAISIFPTNLTNPYFTSTLFGHVSSVDFQALLMKKLSYNSQLVTMVVLIS